MIHVLDAMTPKLGRLDEVRRLLRERYMPGARARGMQLVGEWLVPSVAARDRGGEWIVLWKVGDIAAWWGMRAKASVDPEVATFWRDADACLEGRSRRMLAPDAGDGRSDPPRRCRLGSGDWPGQRATALLTLAPGALEDAGARLEALARALPRRVLGCLRGEIGRNLPGTWNGGDYTLDLVFEDAGSAARWLEGAWSEPAAWGAWGELVQRVDAVHYAPLEGGLDAPRIVSPVKRTLLLRVEPGAPPDRIARFERELAAMPDHIPAIRNWLFARTTGTCGPQGAAAEGERRQSLAEQGGVAAAPRAEGERRQSGWTHVWAQEFETLDGLQTDYMLHPYHWAVVDRWFDPESPERIVAPDFAHVFCAMPQSVLG